MQLNQTDTTRQLGMLLARIFKGFWQWVLLVNALIWMQLAAAQTASVQVGIQDRYELSRSFTFLEDSSATLTLGDILQPAAQAGFRAVPQGATSTNFGSTNSAIWLRVVLQTVPSSPRHWMFEVAYPPLDRMDLYISSPVHGVGACGKPPLDRMDLYISSPGGQFIQQSGGDSLPFASRLVPHRSHIKPIELEPGSSTTVYLRIASQGSVSGPSRFGSRPPCGSKIKRPIPCSVCTLVFCLVCCSTTCYCLCRFAIRLTSSMWCLWRLSVCPKRRIPGWGGAISLARRVVVEQQLH
jgi:hypothetical protein